MTHPLTPVALALATLEGMSLTLISTTYLMFVGYAIWTRATAWLRTPPARWVVPSSGLLGASLWWWDWHLLINDQPGFRYVPLLVNVGLAMLISTGIYSAVVTFMAWRAAPQVARSVASSRPS